MKKIVSVIALLLMTSAANAQFGPGPGPVPAPGTLPGGSQYQLQYNYNTAVFGGISGATSTDGISVIFASGSLKLAGATSGTAVLNAPATGGGVLTLPAGTDNIISRNSTDTFNNKTISGASNTLSNIGNSSLVNSSMTIAGHTVSLGGTQAIAAGDLSNGTTGSGAVVLASSPTITGTLTVTNLNISGLFKDEFSTGTNAPIAKFGSTDQNRGIWEGVNTGGNAWIQPYRPSDGDTSNYPLYLGNASASAQTVVNGILGVGMVPSNVLDITQNQNTSSVISLLNNSAGSFANAQLALSNGTHIAQVGMFGTGYTTTGLQRQDGGFVYSNGAGGLTLFVGSAQPLYFGTNNSLVGQFNSSGQLLINTASPVSTEKLRVNGSVYADGQITANNGAIVNNGISITGTGNISLSGTGQTISASDLTIEGDTGGGAIMYVGGFGTNIAYGWGSISVPVGNPPSNIDVIARTNGVRLADGATSWSALSDYRAKIDKGGFKNALKLVEGVPIHLAALKTTPHNFKAMFLAHELQREVPWAVQGKKDGPKMQMIESTDPLVPILWKAVQELSAKVDADEKLLKVRRRH